MNSQLAFNGTRQYDALTRVGKCIGILCGAPVYVNPERPSLAALYGNFKAITDTVVASGVQPKNQMGRISSNTIPFTKVRP